MQLEIGITKTQSLMPIIVDKLDTDYSVCVSFNICMQ